MKMVFVNATSMTGGGALSILKQFLETLKQNGDGLNVYVFCDIEKKDYEGEHIHIINVNTNLKWRKRITWDLWGMKRWSVQNNINPDVVFSLQNTGIGGFSNTPQIVYLHQSIPFSREIKWKINRAERKYWFYRYIYKFMLRFSIPAHANIVVQTDWVREAVLQDFHWPDAQLHKYRPCITKIDSAKIQPFDMGEKIILFYPTSPPPFKNSNLLYRALAWIKENDSLEDIHLVLTLESDNETLKKLEEFRISEAVKFIGSVTYEEVVRWYATSHALLFPSLIETFGLPLLEAQQFGIPIIAVDLPYAREACSNYAGVKFLPKDNPEAWGKTIIDLRKKLPAKIPINVDGTNQWWDLIDWIKVLK